MHGAVSKKPFVDLVLTEEASLLHVTLHSGGGEHGHGHGHGHGHDDPPKGKHHPHGDHF